MSIAAILLLIKSPNEVWLVPFIRGSAGIISLIASFILAYRKFPIQFPTPTLVIHALKSGWSAFIFKGTASLFAIGNSFILGLVAPVHIVGYNAGAEKINKALMVLLWPTNWTLYSHLSHLVVLSIERAAKLVRFTVVILVVLGSGAALLTILISPVLVNFVLGSGFEKAIPALVVLLGILPLTAFTAVLGTQWMFALGMERQFTKIVTAAGLVKLAGIVLLAPYFGHVGVAFATLIAQAIEAITLYGQLSKRNLSPFQKHFINPPSFSTD